MEEGREEVKYTGKELQILGYQKKEREKNWPPYASFNHSHIAVSTPGSSLVHRPGRPTRSSIMIMDHDTLKKERKDGRKVMCVK